MLASPPWADDCISLFIRRKINYNRTENCTVSTACKKQGFSKVAHPARLGIVLMVRAGAVEGSGGDPCGRPGELSKRTGKSRYAARGPPGCPHAQLPSLPRAVLCLCAHGSGNRSSQYSPGAPRDCIYPQ